MKKTIIIIKEMSVLRRIKPRTTLYTQLYNLYNTFTLRRTTDAAVVLAPFHEFAHSYKLN